MGRSADGPRSPGWSTDEDTATRREGGAMRVDPVAPGTKLGRFVVEEEIGAGGMGSVLRAWDPELCRHVAVKLLHADTPEANARALREAQALAKLAHPHVVPVYDVGEARGAVFFAMELVVGETLRDWLDERAHGWTDVLERLTAAGAGLAAAHRAGIVHRDFKPANVLLGLDDRVLVTDFGLARGSAGSTDAYDGIHSASGSSMDGRITAHGLVLGTPPYMAPEQHRGIDGDARSDQYSFCVAAYEALFGVRPFVGATLAELARAKELGRPQPASGVRVPRWLRRAVVRGLAPAPEDRWPSMDALLRALEHRRSGALVLAGAGAVALGVAAIVVVAPVDERCTGAEQQIDAVWNDAARERLQSAFIATDAPYAARTVELASAALDRYAARWIESRTDACAATQLRHEQSADALDARMQCLDGHRRALTAVVTTLGTADAVVVEHAVRTIAALPPIDRCTLAAVGTSELDDPAARARIDAVRDELARSRSLLDAGKPDEARSVAEQALADAESMDAPALVAEAKLRLGYIADEDGRFPEAEARLSEAYFLAREVGLPDVAADASAQLVAVVGSSLERPREGMQWAEQARIEVERSGDPLAEAALASRLGALHNSAGDLELAQTHFERALELEQAAFGTGDPRSAQTLLNLGSIHGLRGDYDRTLEYSQRALEILQVSLGPEHPETADALGNIGNVYLVRQELDAALDHMTRAVTINEASYGPDHPNVAKWLNNRGIVHTARKEYDAALADLRRSLAIREAALGRDHPMVARSFISLGNLHRARKEYDLARDAYERAATVFETVHGPDHPDTGMARNNLGVVLEAQQRWPEALAAYRTALAIFTKTLGDDHPNAASAHANIGNVSSAMGDPAAAIPEHERALAIRERVLPPGHPDIERVRDALAKDRVELAALRQR